MTTLPQLAGTPPPVPPCRWRGDGVVRGRFACRSPKLVVGPTGVSPFVCAACPYADHEPVAARPVTVRPPVPATGPGTQLKLLIARLGLSPTGGCACDRRADQMNIWGPAGCLEHRAEIVGWLAEEWGRLGWLDRLKVGVRALGRVDLLDPIGGVVDEAIRLAEEEVPS